MKYFIWAYNPKVVGIRPSHRIGKTKTRALSLPRLASVFAERRFQNWLSIPLASIFWKNIGKCKKGVQKRLIGSSLFRRGSAQALMFS